MANLRDSITRSIKQLSGEGLTPHELVDDTAKPVRGKRQHWGYHLILDVSDGNKNIDDEKAVGAFLKDLVKALKMKAVGEPMIVRTDDQTGRGLSAVQIITTSSITFHGDDDEWCAYIDIFSCKSFEPQHAIGVVEKYFSPKHIGKFFLYRDAGRWPEK